MRLTTAAAVATIVACSSGDGADTSTDTCAGDGALATCLKPTLSAETYANLSSSYFDTMDYRVQLDAWPPYSERVARWEWPPWLKLTAYTRENIEATDTLLVLYPSIVDDRDCRGFDTHPFGRCRVTFYYDEHDGRPCPIYEEFTFNDAGEITWIEAWSDLPGLRPMDDAVDEWADATDIQRLSSRIPGLGNSHGLIDPAGPEMAAAASKDADVADFVTRTQDWAGTWAEELRQSGGDAMWETGCGW